MYSEDYTNPPRDEAHFWELVDGNLYAAEIVLNYHLETKEEALSGEYREDENGNYSLLPMNVISYVHDPNGHDMRDDYYELGRKMLPVVRRMAKKRKITPKFLHVWGVLQSASCRCWALSSCPICARATFANGMPN